MHKAGGLCLLLWMLVAGCMPQAVGTPPPPLTLTPPPTLTFTGSCADNRDLSDWLEYSTFYVEEFTKLVSVAAAKHIYETFDDVIMMSRMRADFSGVAAPDCAETAHQMIVRAMNRAVDGFQAVINQDADGLGSTVAEVLGQFDQAIALQNDLTARLETQLQAGP
jgi:hypothetical protein